MPRGTKDAVTFPNDNFGLVAKALASSRLRSLDFSKAIETAKNDDFVFIDPPYTVRHNHNGFVKYNQKIFSWEDQIRLRDAVRSAAQSGVKFLVTNANHPSIADLYRGLGQTFAVSRSSVIAGSAAHRGRYEEIAFVIGYDVKKSACRLDLYRECSKAAPAREGWQGQVFSD